MNEIHPSAIIGPEVAIGTGNVIGPNCVLIGPLEIGDDNWFGPGVAIGTPPEVRSTPHTAGWNRVETTSLTRIGSRNVIREGVSIQQGFYGHTEIGSDCFIMSRAYIAHDCVIEDVVTISANVSLAGHCQIQTKANLGLASSFHQFSVVGSGAMVGMGAVITKPVPPFSKVYGVPGRIQGANLRGMQLNGFADDTATAWEDTLTRTQDLLALASEEIAGQLSRWRDAIKKNSRS